MRYVLNVPLKEYRVSQKRNSTLLFRRLGYVHTVPDRFCSVSKVASVQCEQELMFCCGAEIVPKRSQCEQKPYPLCNLQRSLLIWKDNLPIRGSVAISAPIKVFRLDSDRLKNLSDTERSTFNSGAVLFRSRNCFESSIPSVNRSPIRYTFCDAPFHYPVQCEHSLSFVLSG